MDEITYSLTFPSYLLFLPLPPLSLCLSLPLPPPFFFPFQLFSLWLLPLFFSTIEIFLVEHFWSFNMSLLEESVKSE